MADDPNPKSSDEELDDTVDTADDDAPDDAADDAADETGDEGDDGVDESDEAGDEGDGEDDAEPASDRVARGRPDRGQRDARRSREARLIKRNKELERMAREGGQPRIDPQQSQREYEQREERMLEEARINGPDAVSKYYYERGQRENAGRIQGMRNQDFERGDARDFRATCREDGISRDLQDYVEDHISYARQQGNFLLTREAVLNHRLGELARQRKRNGGSDRQRDRGERRIERQTVRAPRGSSDVARPSRRSGRMEDMSVEDIEKNFGNIKFGTIR